MSRRIADRVKEATVSVGAGDLVLGGALPGYRPFAAVCDDGDTFPYCLLDNSNNTWEVGTGTYHRGTNSFTRAPEASSSGGARVALTNASQAVVFMAATASLLTLPPAAAAVLGGVQVGLGLSIDGDGVLSVGTGGAGRPLITPADGVLTVPDDVAELGLASYAAIISVQTAAMLAGDQSVPAGRRLRIVFQAGGLLAGSGISGWWYQPGRAGVVDLMEAGGMWAIVTPPPRSIATDLVAAGIGQSDALPIMAQVNVVSTVAAGAGVVLPAWLTEGEIAIHNAGANDLLVYPPGDAQIGAAAAGAPVIVGPSQRVNFATSLPTAQWIAG
jgi:hypothetical protein